MAKLLPYNPKVEVLWATPEPEASIFMAAHNTMKGIFADKVQVGVNMARLLYEANHGSPLEHAVISMDITQISRACLDQIVRHRMGSFTSSSQHYQNHKDYPHRVSLALLANEGQRAVSIDMAMQEYTWAISSNIAYEDARMLLPMSTEVRLIWTVNARSLANFLNLRLCMRNVVEMLLLAKRVHKIAKKWFPDLFLHVGADCFQTKCRQGKMKCDAAARFEEVKQYD